MPVKFFSQYLVDEGIIEPHQLKDVYDHSFYLHRTIGELAVKWGLMTQADMERVLGLQEDTDRLSGELCVEQGLLTREQLEELLAHQRQHHARVGEILVELGHLDEATLNSALACYRADQAPYESATRALPPELQSTPAELVLDLLPRLALRLGTMQLRLGDTRPWDGSDVREVSVTVHLPTTPKLAVGLSTAERFARALLQQARGSVEPEASQAEVRQALERFAEKLGRRVHAGAATAEWGQLPSGGHAFEFISTRGNGLIILARE